MFFPEYWALFDAETPAEELLMHGQPADMAHGLLADTPPQRARNQTFLHMAFALHRPHETIAESRLSEFVHLPRALFALMKRDFQCPAGTDVCTGIDRPNSCCPSGLACQSITDSGSGDVGCCAEGGTCGGVAKCGDDQQSCPASQGGGCCVAGYSCAGVGCEAASTATVTVNPTVTASPPPSPPSTSTSSSESASTQISTSTETHVTSVTSTKTSSPPSSSRTSSTERAAPVAPVRPTSGSVSTTETTTGPTTTFTPTACPTGFYACNAHYLGGCCRIGRDCSSTSCPAPPSSQVLVSNGVSIGVAPPEATRLGEDGCALGWFKCDSGGGGGCCPSGYACGESCTATGVNLGAGVTGTAKVAKDNGAIKTTGNSDIWRGLSVVASLVLSAISMI